MSQLAGLDKIHLPPGLWLPLAEESTEQYKDEVFDRADHEYERIVDFGMFAVALACFDDERRDHGSLMPTERDIRGLKQAGYGVSRYHIDRDYGGYARLQAALGYYPRDYKPTREDLIGRLKWIADEVIPSATHFEGSRNQVEDLLQWGKRRRLLPSRQIVHEVLDGDKELLRDIFLLPNMPTADGYSKADVYRMAAKVLKEHGGPVTQKEFNELAPSSRSSKPYQAVFHTFGSMRNLWKEFGYITDSATMTAQDLVGCGVRFSIQNDGAKLTKPIIESLSKAKRFPSTFMIAKEFGGSIRQYREEVGELYKLFEAAKKQLISYGVSQEMIKLIAWQYKVGVDFENYLLDHREILKTLSEDSKSAKYITGLIQSGFDLEFDYIAKMQHTDFCKHLDILGINDRENRNFVLGLIPRALAVDFLKQ